MDLERSTLNWLSHPPPNNKGGGEAAREQGLEYLCTANLCSPPTTSHCTASPQMEKRRADIRADMDPSSFLCHSWLMIPELWKLSTSGTSALAVKPGLTMPEATNTKEGKASAVWCSEGCLLWAAASFSALQSILIHLFMPASLLLSPNRKKWPDSATVFLCTCCYPWLGSSCRIAKHLNYSASVVDSALKLHWCFLK